MNIKPSTHRREWPWKVQVGQKWCGLLAPWERLLEMGGSVVPLVIGTMPTDIVVKALVFIAKGTLIMSLWQVRTLPLVIDIVMPSQILGQKVWYRRLGHVPAQTQVLSQGRNTACILLWRADLLFLVPLKHLYYYPLVSLSLQDHWEGNMTSIHSSVIVQSVLHLVMDYMGPREH